MNFLMALLIFGLCFAGMAIGLIVAKKVLQKGCAMSPEDCACRREGKDPDECDYDPSKDSNS